MQKQGSWSGKFQKKFNNEEKKKEKAHAGWEFKYRKKLQPSSVNDDRSEIGA